MAVVAGEGQKLDISLQQQQTSLNVAEKGAQANLLQSQVNEQNNETDIQFLQDYGWMSVASQGLNAASSGLKIASNMDWGGSSPSMTPASSEPFNSGGAMPYYAPQTSLATENFNYAYGGFTIGY
jgi:hypothetical protein